MLTLLTTVLGAGAVTAAPVLTEPTGEDVIILGGQIFPIKGPIRGEPASEFETGIKVGTPTYDHREHAFFLVMDDWSAGFGYRRLGVRDELGTFWDVNPDNAPDTRRPGHLTLAPKSNIIALPQLQNAVSGTVDKADRAHYQYSSVVLFMVGSALYKLNVGSPSGATKVLDMANFGYVNSQSPGSIVLYSESYNPNAPGWGGSGGAVGTGLGGGGSGDDNTESSGGHVVQGTRGIIGLGGGSNPDVVDTAATFYRLFAFWGNAGSFEVTHAESNDLSGTTWQVGTKKALQHGIYWDNKIIVGHNAILFGVLDPDTVNSATPEIRWNTEDPADGELIWGGPNGTMRFIGVAQAPWGEPAVHFYDFRSLWVLDFYARKAYPIDTGINDFISHAVMWNGYIALTDGWNVFLYTPGQGTVRNIGLPRKYGIPPSVRGETLQGGFAYLIPSAEYLFAVMGIPDSSGNVSRISIFCYNGVGWAQLGRSYSYLYPQGGFQASNAAWQGSQPWGLTRRVYVPVLDKTSTAGAGTTNQAKVLELQVPSFSQTPVVGVDHFEPAGAYLISGWIDGGFNDINGTLLYMTCDAFSLTEAETVKVEYRLDNNESDSAWIQMVNLGNVADVFDTETRTLYFQQPALDDRNPQKGLGFRTVQFRVTLNRGDDDTLSPEVRALTLSYLKTPELRTTWTFPIDVNRMIERTANGNDGVYGIDGGQTTVLAAWNKFKSLWNAHALLPLTIPNVEERIYVKVAGMPVNLDDFKDAVDGRGVLELTVIEPVARPS